MKKRKHLGHVELLALVVTMRLGEEAYGVAIAREIEKAGGRDLPLASLYLTLERLETNGLIESELGEPTPERGGRAKTYFRVTAAGVREVRDARRTLTSLWDGVPALEVS